MQLLELGFAKNLSNKDKNESKKSINYLIKDLTLRDML